MSYQVTMAIAFLLGFVIGWAGCAAGISVKLSFDQKRELIRKWRIELEEHEVMLRRVAEEARRRARES